MMQERYRNELQGSYPSEVLLTVLHTVEVLEGLRGETANEELFSQENILKLVRVCLLKQGLQPFSSLL